MHCRRLVAALAVSLIGTSAPVAARVTVELATTQAPAAPSGQTNTGGAMPAVDPNTAAQLWLESTMGRDAVQDLESPRADPPKRLLIHLPSGKVAASAPASLPENRPFQVAIVIVQKKTAPKPGAWKVDVQVTECPERDAFRIKGDFTGIGTKVGPSELLAEEYSFALLPVGQTFECGTGHLRYALTVNEGDPVEASWRIRPVYHLTAGVGIGFDFGKTHKFSAPNRVVIESKQTVGLSGSAGFIWYPSGVDFERMKPWQHFLSPFVLFDLDAPKDGFIVGTALTASGGLSVAIGMSVRKVSVLTSHKVDDAFTGEGEVPTDLAWTKDGVHLYVGVIFDTTLFTKLKGMTAK